MLSLPDPREDMAFMARAIDLAREGLGRTAPNPSVGCVIVTDGEIVGAGRTADGGRPHAETVALMQAGDKARGATVYVTLEPCNTHGKTGPCVDALIAAGVSHVVIANVDPFQARHGGIDKLQDAGIHVTIGMMQDEAARVNEGFFTKLRAGRPFITAKIATTLDGRIALANGSSKWITGEQARTAAHHLRAANDAILVGIGTVLADDPALTTRLPDVTHNAVRVIIDPSLKIPLTSRLVQTALQTPVWVLCSEDADGEKEAALEGAGVTVIRTPLDVPAMLATLGACGLTRLLVEGGGKTLSGFLAAGLIDRLVWFRAPKIIGGEGVSAFGALGLEKMEQIPMFSLEETARLGEDSMEIWRRKV